MSIYDLTVLGSETIKKRENLKKYTYKADAFMGGSYAMADVVAMSYKDTPSRYAGITQVALENPSLIDMSKDEVEKDPGKAVQRIYNRTILDISTAVFDSVLKQTKDVNKANKSANMAFNYYYGTVQSFDEKDRASVFRDQVGSMLRYNEDGTAYTDMSSLHSYFFDNAAAKNISEDMIPFGNNKDDFKVRTIASKNMNLDYSDQVMAAIKDNNILSGMTTLFAGPNKTSAKARTYQEQYGASLASQIVGMATNIGQTIGLTMLGSGIGNMAKGTKAIKYMRNVTSMVPLVTNVTQSAIKDATNEMYGFNERYFREIERNDTTNMGKWWLTRGFDAGTYVAGSLVGSWLWESKFFGGSLAKIGGLSGLDKVKALMMNQIKYPILDATSDLLIDIASANLLFRPFEALTDPTAMSMDVNINPELSAAQNTYQNLYKFASQYGMRLGGRISGAIVNSGYRQRFNKESQYQNLLGTNEWINSTLRGVELNTMDRYTVNAMKGMNWLFGNSLDAMDIYYRDRNNKAPLEGRLTQMYEGKTKLSKEEGRNALGNFYMSMEATKNVAVDKLWSVLTTGKWSSRYIKELNYGKPGIDQTLIGSLNKLMTISPLNVKNKQDIQDIGYAVGDTIFRQLGTDAENIKDKDFIEDSISKLYIGHNFTKEDKLELQHYISRRITDNLSGASEDDKSKLISRYDNVRNSLNSIATYRPSKTQLSSAIMKYTNTIHDDVVTGRQGATVDDTIIGKKAAERGGVSYVSTTTDIDEALRSNQGQIQEVIKYVKDMMDNGEDLITMISGSSINDAVKNLIDGGKVNFDFIAEDEKDYFKWHVRVKQELHSSMGDVIQSKIDSISELLVNASANIAAGKQNKKADAGLGDVSNQLVMRNKELHDLILIFPDHQDRLNTFIGDIENGNKFSKEAISIYNSAAKNSPIFKAITKDVKETEESYTAVQGLRYLVDISRGQIERRVMSNNMLKGTETNNIGFDAVMRLLKADDYNLNEDLGRRYIARNAGFAPTEMTGTYVIDKNGNKVKRGAKFMSDITNVINIFSDKQASEILKNSSAQEAIIGTLEASLIKYNAIRKGSVTIKEKGVDGYNKTKALLKDIFNIEVKENTDGTIDIDYRTIDLESSVPKIKDNFAAIQKNTLSAYLMRDALTSEGIDKVVYYKDRIKGSSEQSGKFIFRSSADIYSAISIKQSMKEIEQKLVEIALLKAKQQAIEELLDGLYKEVETGLKDSGLQRLTCGEVQAVVQGRTTWVYLGGDGLMDYVSDPVKFGHILLTKCSIPKKVIEALETVGVPAVKYFRANERQILTVRVGKQEQAKERILESQKEYQKELAELRKKLKVVTSPIPIPTAVYPEKTKIDKKVDQMLEEEGC